MTFIFIKLSKKQRKIVYIDKQAEKKVIDSIPFFPVVRNPKNNKVLKIITRSIHIIRITSVYIVKCEDSNKGHLGLHKNDINPLMRTLKPFSFNKWVVGFLLNEHKNLHPSYKRCVNNS